MAHGRVHPMLAPAAGISPMLRGITLPFDFKKFFDGVGSI
jgi:hypothetical protein